MLKQLSIQQRFRALLVFSLGCFALCGVIVYGAMSEIRVNGPIYQRIMQGQDLVADILPPPEYILESYLVTLQLAAAPNRARLDQLAQRLQQLDDEYEQRYRYWQNQHLQGQLADKFLSDSHSLAAAFYDIAFKELVPALRRQDSAAAAQAMARLGVTYEQQRHAIEQVVLLARQRNKNDEAAARARMDVMVVSLVLIFALTLMVFVFIFNTVQRSIAEPLQDAISITRKVAAGDWGHKFRASSNDEAGHLLTAIKDIVKNTQAELVKSEKMAALGSLVAGVSHELNTPVGNGLMAVSTLSDDLRTFRSKIAAGVRRSTLDEFLQSVETGAAIATRNLERAAELMCSFKQVAADRTSAQRRRFELDQVIHETQMTLQPMLRRAPCQVRLEVPAGIRLDSFPGPLGQVISNMIENAVKHAFADGDRGLITVSARMTERASRVQISVADNGRGIPAALQARVFDPFFTTRMGQGGSGLGLHIAHNIVYQMLGGTIQLASREGNGTVFEITLPVEAPGDLIAA